jgi:hypothetical protein
MRTVLHGSPVEPRTVPTHLVDVTSERERVEHHVRIGDTIAARLHGPPPIGRVF